MAASPTHRFIPDRLTPACSFASAEPALKRACGSNISPCDKAVAAGYSTAIHHDDTKIEPIMRIFNIWSFFFVAS
jgi:hypothetical protein